MARKLFGENITPACEICAFAALEDEKIICEQKGERSRADACGKFKYDPIKRMPKKAMERKTFSPADFSIES